MNLLLLTDEDIPDHGAIRIFGRRCKHLQTVLKVRPGDRLKAGLLNGKLGQATVISVTAEHVELELTLTTSPPEPLPVSLVLALPRPKMLKRILQTVASLGVKDLHLINSYRVEKSYWQSPWLLKKNIREQLVLGLEQGVDTTLPTVTLHKGFKPFVEDRLPSLVREKQAFFATPGAYPRCPSNIKGAAVVVIGPEGGFIPYEITQLLATNCRPVTLGERILKVETAVSVILGKLF